MNSAQPILGLTMHVFWCAPTDFLEETLFVFQSQINNVLLINISTQPLAAVMPVEAHAHLAKETQISVQDVSTTSA